MTVVGLHMHGKESLRERGRDPETDRQTDRQTETGKDREELGIETGGGEKKRREKQRE